MIKRTLAAILFAGVVAAGFAAGSNYAVAKSTKPSIAKADHGVSAPQMRGPENEL